MSEAAVDTQEQAVEQPTQEPVVEETPTAEIQQDAPEHGYSDTSESTTEGPSSDDLFGIDDESEATEHPLGDADSEEPSEQSKDSEEQMPEAAAQMVKLDDGTEVPLDELKKGYLRQSDYTKKTQERAQQMRELAAKEAHINGELYNFTPAENTEIAKMALTEAERIYGQDFDAYSPTGASQLNAVEQQIRFNEVVGRRRANTVAELKQSEPHYNYVSQIAESMMQNEMSGAEANLVLSAAQRGNFEPMKRVFAEAQGRFRTAMARQQQQRQQPQPQPNPQQPVQQYQQPMQRQAMQAPPPPPPQQPVRPQVEPPVVESAGAGKKTGKPNKGPDVMALFGMD